jgi:prevent-host-death family protein
MFKHEKLTSARRSRRLAQAGRWSLELAKARFSEVVRLARSEGPQRVTVQGRDEVVVVAADTFSRLEESRTGEALVAAFQSSPHRDVELAPVRTPMPVRDSAP